VIEGLGREPARGPELVVNVRIEIDLCHAIKYPVSFAYPSSGY
jgi:hypothetical protein